MASIHYLKRSTTEAVVKIYVTESAGATVDLFLADLVHPSQSVNGAVVTIKEIFWGCKPNKHIDISRWDGATPHGHYYFVNSGSHECIPIEIYESLVMDHSTSS